MPIIRAPDNARRKSLLPSLARSKKSTNELPIPQPQLLHHASSLSTLSKGLANPSTQSTPNLLWTPPKPGKSSPSATPQNNTQQAISDSNSSRKKRKSWLPLLSKPLDHPKTSVRAWIGGHQNKVVYDVSSLTGTCRVPELWDDSGNTLIYLHSTVPAREASFKIHSSLIASSLVLMALIRTSSTTSRQPNTLTSTDAWSVPDSNWRISRDDTDSDCDILTLVLPLNLSAASPNNVPSTTGEDLDTLIAVRNLFAFLNGQSLVCTEKWPSLFSVFLKTADLLKMYNFTNIDGSTLGEIPAQSFDNYINELSLADVRGSHEKAVEALILGERMRSAVLFNEAFTHAAGKYHSIQGSLKNPEALAKFRLLSTSTRNRLERAAIDLDARRENADARLSDFEFPSVFAGIMSSKTAPERKQINFDAWKTAFAAMRKQVLSYYRSQYGSWPPRPKSQHALPGLNRLVLKTLYRDFAELYDLWVDRTALTCRKFDDSFDDSQPPAHRVIRRVCDEYDRSVPPVQPAVPFDVPIIPSLYMTRSDHGVDAKKDVKARNKKLSPPEIDRLLDISANPDTRSAPQRSPFVAAIDAWERKQARGRTLTEICDLRCGAWIFLYAVIQSLPMLVVDAPGLQFHSGVEYFLCVPPRSGVPWAGGQSGAGRQSFYRIAGESERVVSLPCDLIEHGVEGTYRRSHCWLMAAKWSRDPCFADATSALQCDFEQFDPYQTQTQDQITQHTTFSSWTDRADQLAPPPQYYTSALTSSTPSLALQSTSHEYKPMQYIPWRRPSDDRTAADSRPGTERSTPASSQGFHQRSSPYQSRPATPTQALQRGRQRDRVLASGLEALPFNHLLSSQAANYARDTSRSSGAQTADFDAGDMPEATGVTFDDIIAGISYEKVGEVKVAVRPSKK